MFKVNDKVQRNPRIWKNDTTVYTVRCVDKKHVWIQKPGKTKCPFTGQMVAHMVLPFEPRELVRVI